jgi:hypothetical protein
MVQLLAANCKISDHTYRISGPTTTVHLSLGLRVTRLLALAVVTVEHGSVSHSTLRNSMLTLSTQHCLFCHLALYITINSMLTVEGSVFSASSHIGPHYQGTRVIFNR